MDTFGLSGVLSGATITNANDQDVCSAMGFAIGGFAPVGHPEPLPSPHLRWWSWWAVSFLWRGYWRPTQVLVTQKARA